MLETAAADVPALINITDVFCVEHTALAVPLSVPGVTLCSHSLKDLLQLGLNTVSPEAQ